MQYRRVIGGVRPGWRAVRGVQRDPVVRPGQRVHCQDGDRDVYADLPAAREELRIGGLRRLPARVRNLPDGTDLRRRGERERVRRRDVYAEDVRRTGEELRDGE